MVEQVRLEQPELINKDLDLLELVGNSKILRRTSNKIDKIREFFEFYE